MNNEQHNKAINSHCPWSGDAVSSDSLTHYKGQVVGFCNPGCRDKFQTACTHFEAALAVPDAVTVTAPAPITSAYQARHFAFNTWWDIAGIRFKVYTIHGQQQAGVDQALLDQAHDYVTTQLPTALATENPHHGCGYIVVHQGEVADWLLIHWWSDQDICLHMLAYQEPSHPGFTSAADRRFHACVWEQVVINHEKDAWVRLLQTADHPLKSYHQDVLPDGSY